MSELCNPDSHFSSLFISDLVLLFSLIISHPLYFSYFIFFFPYLLKLISFLSPLFLTTSLLSLAFFTGLLQENFSTDHSYQKTLLVAYASAVERFRAPKDYYSHNEEVFQGTEDDLGLYEILFGPSLMDDREEEEEEEDEVEFSEEMKSEENHPLRASESVRPENPGPENITMGNNKKNEAVSKVEKNVGPAGEITHPPPVMQEKRLENFLKILDEFERMASDGKKKSTPPPSKGAKTDKAVEKTKITVWAPEKNGSDAATATTGNKISDAAASAKDGKDHSTSLTKSHSQRINSDIDNHNNNNNYDNLGTYGSMRKEKEWKRTLACKLFEERHNVDGGEGMDSLWETYETDSNKTATTKMQRQRKINDRKKKKSDQIHEVFEDEEEIDDPAQLCCLQALKLSAGKMNLGMGRPNLVKISKAIKGFGWLHSVTKSKKVHNSNGDRY